MSIYGSFAIFDGEEDLPAPLIYQRSHVLPHPGDARGGSLDLGLISGWVTRDGKCLHGRDDMCPEDDHVWPYLRVSLTHPNDPEGVTVVLDAAQVAKLHDELATWLDAAGPSGRLWIPANSAGVV